LDRKEGKRRGRRGRMERKQFGGGATRTIAWSLWRGEKCDYSWERRGDCVGGWEIRESGKFLTRGNVRKKRPGLVGKGARIKGEWISDRCTEKEGKGSKKKA